MASTYPDDDKNAFSAFDNELNLDPGERKRAQDLHNEVTGVLRDAGVISGAFLQGSFARKTMIKPLRDIDKCVILPAGTLPAYDSPLGPWLAMQQIIQTLTAHYGTRVVCEPSKHAVKVAFVEESFTFDVVPAFETDDRASDDVLIANTSTDRWETSNTRQLLRVVAERNAATGGRFIHQARMGKHLVRNLLNGDLPGLHVEAFAYHCIAEPLEHAAAVERLLRCGTSLLQGPYLDPTGRDELSRKLKPGVQPRALACFTDAAAKASEALRLAEAGDHRAALAIWGQLFGEPFPAPSGQTVEDAFSRSFAGGSVTTIGTVSSTTISRQPARPARSWRSA